MTITIIALILALFVGGVAFLSAGNIYVSIALSIAFLMYGIFYAKSKITKHLDSITRAHECHHFINSFLLSLSIRNSFGEAYDNAVMNARKDFDNEVRSISNLAIRERIDYLTRYFASDLYGMFLNVLSLYENQGGNILTMGEFIIKEANRIEQPMITMQSLVIRKTFELIMLWMITIAIIIFMRFGLSNFYSLMLNGYVLIIMTISLFAIMLFSFHYAITRFILATEYEGKRYATI